MSNSTTHCIYRLVCFPTGKVYVGQSHNPRLRQRQHFNDLKGNQHPNKHLQSAYNYHGRRAFYFEILERDLSPEQAVIREEYWINYFDAFRSGYNATPGGDPGGGNRTGCIWNNIEYNSISEAARANGIGNSAMRKRLRNGYTCDDDVPARRDMGYPCVWNGIAYDSVVAAAKANNVTEKAMWERIRRGYTSDAEIRNVPCVWNGVLYPSISQAARALGLSFSPMYKRIKKGYTCDADMQRHYRRQKP